jgi:hypothetical protein
MSDETTRPQTPNPFARMNLLAASARSHSSNASLAYVEGYNAALEVVEAFLPDIRESARLTPAQFTPEFQERIDAGIRRCRQVESDGFHGNDERDPANAKLIEDLAQLLRDAYTHNAAWRKRADEAETALAARLTPVGSREPSKEGILP